MVSVAAEKLTTGVGDEMTKAESQIWSISYRFECLKDFYKLLTW